MLEWYHWCDAQRKQWGEAPVGYVYLGEAVLSFGRAIAGEAWQDDDLVYANGEAPRPARSGDSEIPNMLEQARQAREQMRYEAKQRADAVIAHVIEEARQGRLELHTRPTRGGPITKAPAAFWDKEKSRHVFKGCVVSPATPFRIAPPKEWHNVYCDEASLAARLRALPGASVREVSDADLKKVIVANHNKTQTELLKIVSAYFAGRPIPPSPNRIKNLDREMRRGGALPKRTRGRPGHHGAAACTQSGGSLAPIAASPNRHSKKV